MIDRSHFLQFMEPVARGDLIAAKAVALAAADTAHGGGDHEFAEQVRTAFQGSAELPIGLEPLSTKKSLEDLSLPPAVLVQVNKFLREQRRRQALSDASIKPRHKALFVGPPGNGKTVLAGAISRALGYRAYMVRYDDLISNRPGETSRNLLAMFRFAEQEPTLLFFDEFDALGRERGNDQETGEMKRVTSTLLFQFDSVPSHVVCIAATNHSGMLDKAIWRRFNIRIELPRPRLEAFPPFMMQMFAKYGHVPRIGETIDDFDPEIVATRMLPENFSDVELFVENCCRTYVLEREEGNPLEIEKVIWIELDAWATQKRQDI